MSNWWIVARIKEFFKYKGQKKEFKFKYEPTLIDNEFKDRVEEITLIYYRIYQKNGNNECEFSLDVERLIMGLIRKYNIEAEINTNENDNIIEVIKILKNLKTMHHKYFVKNDNLTIEEETTKSINRSLNSINKISPHLINLKLNNDTFEESLPNTKFSISEITNLIIKLLEKLNTDIEKYIKDKDAYYKKYSIRNYFICPEFRKWNYEKYIEDDVRSFIKRVEIKLLDIEKEIPILDLVINKNLEKSLQTNNINIKKDLLNQSIINLKRMYVKYRKKN